MKFSGNITGMKTKIKIGACLRVFETFSDRFLDFALFFDFRTSKNSFDFFLHVLGSTIVEFTILR